MDDIEAAGHLERALMGLGYRQIPQELFLGLLSIGLLLSDYGQKNDPVLNNWLNLPHPTNGPCQGQMIDGGCLHHYETPEEGASAMVKHVMQYVPAQVWESHDRGRLAWEILTQGLLGVRPTPKWWKMIKGALKIIFERYQQTLGAPAVWGKSSFQPPILAPSTWTHKTAELALRKFLPEDISTRFRVGLLLWASIASNNYGMTDDGKHTYNWGMIGRPLAEGEALPPGHIIDESGRFAIRIFPSADEGIQAFLDRVSDCRALASGDMGKLAEAMIVRDAFGTHVPLNQDSWGSLKGTMIHTHKEILAETGLSSRWERGTHVPKNIQEVTIAQVKDKTKEPYRRIPWEYIAVALPVVILGAGSYWSKRKNDAAKAKAEAPSEQEDGDSSESAVNLPALKGGASQSAYAR